MPLQKQGIDQLLQQIKQYKTAKEGERTAVPCVLMAAGGQMPWPHHLTIDPDQIVLDEQGNVRRCAFMSYGRVNEPAKIVTPDELYSGMVQVFDLEPTDEIKQIAGAQKQADNKGFIESFTAAMRDVGQPQEVVDSCLAGKEA